MRLVQVAKTLARQSHERTLRLTLSPMSLHLSQIPFTVPVMAFGLSPKGYGVAEKFIRLTGENFRGRMGDSARITAG